MKKNYINLYEATHNICWTDNRNGIVCVCVRYILCSQLKCIEVWLTLNPSWFPHLPHIFFSLHISIERIDKLHAFSFGSSLHHHCKCIVLNAIFTMNKFYLSAQRIDDKIDALYTKVERDHRNYSHLKFNFKSLGKSFELCVFFFCFWFGLAFKIIK